ncbi:MULTISPECIES: hypothetical protein [Hyphobacterium]|uniref:Cache domain-containing protein n=1 Tax=Hyphobacterium vulgare TaxID=1736751 RepID=A0ABV6ZWC8_9PROT
MRAAGNVWMVLVFAIVASSAAAMVAYSVTAERQERLVVEEMTRDISERANRQRALFEDASRAHIAAQRTFLRRYGALQGQDVSADFNRLFPLQPDGTHRSRDDLFEGGAFAFGDDVRGMGAFIPAAAEMTNDRQRMILAAFQTVRQHGEALHTRFDNLYFFTPHNDLIIFGPERADRLEFYRREAPADFDFQDESLARVVAPQSNPLGATACTALRRLIYVTDGSALTTGCHTPVRVGGRHIGAFGITIAMGDYLATSVLDTVPHTENMILTRAGDLIAHRDLVGIDPLTPEAVAAAEASARSGEFAQRIRNDGRQNGAFRTSDGRIVGFARIDTPGWYFVSVQPDWLAHSRTSQLAFLVFLFTFLGVLAQSALVAAVVWWQAGQRQAVRTA